MIYLSECNCSYVHLRACVRTSSRLTPSLSLSLYLCLSSAFYDQHMKQFQEPEILRTPLEDLLLQVSRGTARHE